MLAISTSLFSLGTVKGYVRPIQGYPNLEPLVESLKPNTPVVWLDSAKVSAHTGRWSMLGYDPWLTLIAHGDHVSVHTRSSTQTFRANPLDILRLVLRRYRIHSGAKFHARAFSLFGFMSYDLNRWIENLPSPQPCAHPVPEMLWFAMRTIVIIDHLEQMSWLISIIDPHSPQRIARCEALEALDFAEANLVPQIDDKLSDSPSAFSAQDLNQDIKPSFFASVAEPTVSKQEFESMVNSVLAHIRAGDIFQANISQRFVSPWSSSSLLLYNVLRKINPSPFACYLSWRDIAVVSCSPERLVRVQEGRIDTRPIAGTRPRGQGLFGDAINSLELLLSEKERSEHIMLVDLGRNDLGRVCSVGSVSVDELMALEEYSHVIHIVSNISGMLRKGLDAVDVIRAIFPGGTITGCPKVRCMQILRALEVVPRGLYTGSIGYLGFDGALDLNIAIRTIVVQKGQLSFHVGAGIVADSEPEREYHETLAKAGALIEALRSLNTARIL